MKQDFDNITVKNKCTLILLSCLDWGFNPRNHSQIEERMRKRLNFQYNFDAKRLRSCIDLIGDTEDAIRYFSKFGLHKYDPKLNTDLGEIYLKLYGILNAIYLQIYGIIEIFEVCRIPNKSATLDKLKKHKIFELRNIAGAHTINYEDRSDYIPDCFNKNFFRITQMQLNSKADNLHAVDGFDNLREYNLYELIMDYNKLSEEILYNATIKYLNSIFSTSQTKKTKLLMHYELIPFKAFNYRNLYENDKLKQSHYKRIKKRLRKDLSESYDTNMEGFKSKSETEFLNDIFNTK
jgi:hypothetical protein